jgi:hypothetical protein
MSTRAKKDRRDLAKRETAPPPLAEFSFWAIRKSPFPPLDELERYELLCPGVARQFFDNFINQTNHRIELEKIVIEGDNKRANIAQIFSFIIILVFFIMATVLFVLGKDIQAVAAIIVGIVPVITSFINSSIKRKEEREAKRKNMGLKNNKGGPP